MRSEIENGEFDDRQISECEGPSQLDQFRWLGGRAVRADEINDEPLEDTATEQRIAMDSRVTTPRSGASDSSRRRVTRNEK